MTKYLLPCDCGQSISIDVSQAGQSVSCSCGQTLEIPTLRSIRQLAPDVSSTDRPAVARPWNAAAGLVFAIGSVITLAALGLAAFGYFNWYHHFQYYRYLELPDESVEEYMAYVDQSNAEELLEIWKQTLQMGLPDQESPYVTHRRTARFFGMIMFIGLGLAGCGVLTAAAALLLPRRSSGR